MSRAPSELSLTRHLPLAAAPPALAWDPVPLTGHSTATPTCLPCHPWLQHKLAILGKTKAAGGVALVSPQWESGLCRMLVMASGGQASAPGAANQIIPAHPRSRQLSPQEEAQLLDCGVKARLLLTDPHVQPACSPAVGISPATHHSPVLNPLPGQLRARWEPSA